MSATRYQGQEKFEALEAIAAEADRLPHLQAFARSCRLKIAGLRKPSLAALDECLTDVLALDFASRRQLTGSLLELQLRFGRLLPQPLVARLIEPTLAEWRCGHPRDAAVHRWLGILHNDRDALRTAVSLDGGDRLARVYLLRNLIDSVAFATHHLPDGELLYETAFVRQCLQEAAALLEPMPADDERDALALGLARQRALVEDFLAWQAAPAGSFEDWCERRQRRHHWGVIHRYDA